jgi:hypothetical protein
MKKDKRYFYLRLGLAPTFQSSGRSFHAGKSIKPFFSSLRLLCSLQPGDSRLLLSVRGKDRWREGERVMDEGKGKPQPSVFISSAPSDCGLPGQVLFLLMC